MSILDVGQIGANIYTPANGTIVLNSTHNRIDNYTISESVMDKTVTINMELTTLQELVADRLYIIGYIQNVKLFPKMDAPLSFRSAGAVIVGSVDRLGTSTNGRITMLAKTNIPQNTKIWIDGSYNIGG